MMFLVTKFGFDGFALTVTILTFFVPDVFRSSTFANSALNTRTFRFAPFVRYNLRRWGPMNAHCCSRPISRRRFFRKGRYRPPVGFRRDRPCHRAMGAEPKGWAYLTVPGQPMWTVPYTSKLAMMKPRSAPPFRRGRPACGFPFRT